MPQVPGVVFRLLGTEMAAAYRFPRPRRADPHPFGFAAPRLDPFLLGGESLDRRGLIDVTLVYGDPLDVSARLDLPARQDRARRSPEEALARLPHRDAAVERRGWLAFNSEPASDPERPVAFSDAQSPHRPGVLSSQAAVLAARPGGPVRPRHHGGNHRLPSLPPPRHRLVPADRPQSKGVARLASPRPRTRLPFTGRLSPHPAPTSSKWPTCHL